jgi:hypothetical protein
MNLLVSCGKWPIGLSLLAFIAFDISPSYPSGPSSKQPPFAVESSFIMESGLSPPGTANNAIYGPQRTGGKFHRQLVYSRALCQLHWLGSTRSAIQPHTRYARQCCRFIITTATRE